MNGIDLSRTDLNLLVLFETVMRERHVGRAAARLNLSASAVSHGLRRLRRLLNDPLFLKTPRGVVPTARALTVAGAISDALARVRTVVSSAGPFDPVTSDRRFTIGAPDGASSVVVPLLMDDLGACAPQVDVAVRQLMPIAGDVAAEQAWRTVFPDLESGAMDVAVIPSDEVPARFRVRALYEEPFVLAMRAGHPLRRRLSLERYCAAQHLVVSTTGDPYGFVDHVLKRAGHRRRVALTVPNSLFALAMIARSDLVCALPARFATAHAARFGLVTVEAPINLGRFRLNIVVPEVAMADAGTAWFVDRVMETAKRLTGGAPR